MKAIFTAIAVIMAAIFTTQTAYSENAMQTKSSELKIEAALAVAKLYGLSRGQAILLLAIHDHEAGEPACKEFGIENQPEKIKDPVERYMRYACKSARAIKLWCPDARPVTVRRFNHGFGKENDRYPGYAQDPEWWRCVVRRMRDYKKIIY